MKQFIHLAFLILIFPFSIVSQERYVVEYDYHSDKVSYYHVDNNNKVDDTLSQPKFKRNSLVELKLKNVNPFAVDIETDIKEENLHQSNEGFDFRNLLGGISSFSSQDLGLNINELDDNGLYKNSTRGESISSGFSELNDLSTNVAAMKTTMISNLSNPNLDKNEIIKNIISASATYQDVRLPDPENNMYVYLTKLEQITLEDRAKLLSDINTMSKTIERQSDTIVSFSRGELIERSHLMQNLQDLLNSIDENASNTVENLNKIKSLYAMLEASSFERTYDYTIEADRVDISLKFVQSDFSKTTGEASVENTLKTRSVKLYSKGGFKINTSVALTLNNYGSKSKDYYIDENGEIGADDNSHFVPNLATIINFYPYTNKNINVGGAFGLSIPLSGNENVLGVNFLLGPSLIIGSKSRFALSGGLAYGPVKKLTNGLEVGETTSFGNIDNFTKTVYDFGYFFGISFSIFDLK